MPPPPLLPSGPTPVNPDPPAWSGSSDLLPPGLPPSRYLSGLSPQLPAPCLSPPLLPRPNSWLATRLGAVRHTMHLFIPSRQRELIPRSPSVGHIQEGKRLGGREKLSHPCLAPTSLAPTSLAPTDPWPHLLSNQTPFAPRGRAKVLWLASPNSREMPSGRSHMWAWAQTRGLCVVPPAAPQSTFHS